MKSPLYCVNLLQECRDSAMFDQTKRLKISHNSSIERKFSITNRFNEIEDGLLGNAESGGPSGTTVVVTRIYFMNKGYKDAMLRFSEFYGV